LTETTLEFEEHHWQPYYTSRLAKRAKRVLANIALASTAGWLFLFATFPGHWVFGLLVTLAFVVHFFLGLEQKEVNRVRRLHMKGSMLSVDFLEPGLAEANFDLPQLHCLRIGSDIITLVFDDMSIAIPSNELSATWAKTLNETHLLEPSHYDEMQTSTLYDIRQATADDKQRNLIVSLLDKRTEHEQASEVKEMFTSRQPLEENLVQQSEKIDEKRCLRCGSNRLMPGKYSHAHATHQSFSPDLTHGKWHEIFIPPTFQLSPPLCCLECGLVVANVDHQAIQKYYESQECRDIE
jgi:hypothetical protein